MKGMKKIGLLVGALILIFSTNVLATDDNYYPNNDQSKETIIQLDLDILAQYDTYDEATGNIGIIDDKVQISGIMPDCKPEVGANLWADFYTEKTPKSGYGKQTHILDAYGVKGLKTDTKLIGKQSTIINLKEENTINEVLNSLNMIMDIDVTKIPTNQIRAEMMIETSGYGWNSDPEKSFNMAGVGAERSYSANIPEGGTVYLDSTLNLETTVRAMNKLGTIKSTGSMNDDLHIVTQKDIPLTTDKYTITGQGAASWLEDGYGSKYHVNMIFTHDKQQTGQSPTN